MYGSWRSTYLSSLTAIVFCLLATAAGAQPPAGPGGGPRGGFGGGPPMFFGPGGGTGLELLYSPDVRNEIELVEDQEAAITRAGQQDAGWHAVDLW